MKKRKYTKPEIEAVEIISDRGLAAGLTSTVNSIPEVVHPGVAATRYETPGSKYSLSNRTTRGLRSFDE